MAWHAVLLDRGQFMGQRDLGVLPYEREPPNRLTGPYDLSSKGHAEPPHFGRPGDSSLTGNTT